MAAAKSGRAAARRPEEESSPSSSSARRESRRYRVEIPTAHEEKDWFRNNKSTSSPRPTRPDIPRRHSTRKSNHDEAIDTNSIEVAHSSSFPKKHVKRGDFEEEEDVIIHETPSDAKLKSPPKSPRRKLDHQQEAAHLSPSRQQQSSRRSSSTCVNHQERNGSRNSDKNESHSSNGLANERVKRSSSKTKKSKNQIDDEPLVPTRHFVWMPFGHVRTWSAILFTAGGITLAVFARRSTAFVALEKPLNLTPHMLPVTNVGLVRLHLCFGDGTKMLEQNEHVEMPYMNSVVNVVNDEATTTASSTSTSTAATQCSTVRLSSDIVQDTMWQISRVAASISIAQGSFFCLLLISAIYWESINMKPMAVGLLLTYLLQSFSFFFYDSELCRQHGCKLAMGTYLSILASFCWFGASMLCIVMDVYHTRKMRRLARLERRRRRRLRRAAKLARKGSTNTTQTETSSSGDSDELLEGESSPPAVIVETVEQDESWKV